MKGFHCIGVTWVLAMTVWLLGIAGAAGHHVGLDNSGRPRQERQQRVTTSKPSEGATKVKIQAAYGQLPLHFEANQGQTDAEVKFLARGSGYTLFLTATEAVLVLRQGQAERRNGPRRLLYPPAPEKARPDGLLSEGRSALSPVPHAEGPPQVTLPDARDAHASVAVVRMQLVGANPTPQVVELEELPGKLNYFIGNDSTKWRTNIPVYAKVKYEEIYPGIDLVFYGNQGQLEYDFIIAPGADPNAIRLGFQDWAGQTMPLHIDDQGNLVLQMASGDLRLHKPRIYQEINGTKQPVDGNYVVLGLETPDSPLQALAPESLAPDPRPSTPEVGVQVAGYDASRLLIIDPVLTYSTFLGGSSQDGGGDIAVDAAGNAYVAGGTWSTDFPLANPFQDTPGGTGNAFVTKLNAAGSALIYSTYLSGSSGGGGGSIAVDAVGHAYVTGAAGANFPTTPGAFQPTHRGGGDAIVAKLDPTGSGLIYSTYLGGSGSDQGNRIALDVAGNAYVTGLTWSTDFPTVNPLQAAIGGGDCGGPPCADAFVAKLNAAGSGLIYSTYLGGSGYDSAWGIAVEAFGNAYVTGQTSSTDFPTMNPFQLTHGGGREDAFVAKLNPSGSALIYSTYLGGSTDDIGLGIAVDAAGHAYVTGGAGTAFPTTPGAFQPVYSGDINDAFITKLHASGSVLIYSTYLGGSRGDSAGDIAIDAVGNAYVTGSTRSPDFPTTADAFQPTLGLGGGYDGFMTKLNPTGSTPIYSTYLGANYGDDVVSGITVDTNGNAYVTGSAYSDFPTTPGAFQPRNSGFIDAFVAKISQEAAPQLPHIARISPSAGPPGTLVTIIGENFGASQETNTVDIIGNKLLKP